MSKLESLLRHYSSPAMARFVKRYGVYLRYQMQANQCRIGYRDYGPRYPHPILFVAGLPKSGTTWLERLLASYPGFHEILIPEATRYELLTGGSHDFNLPDTMFDRFEGMLAVCKMHVHGSAQNANLLRRHGIRYVVLYRDLRDVAVSHYFYVRRTPWHPEYPYYRPLTVHQGLELFGCRTLAAFVDWVDSWEQNRDPETSIAIRYEALVDDTAGTFTQVAEHFGLDASPEWIGALIDDNSFHRLSGGRDRGIASEQSFFRKGVIGDWQNYFTPEVAGLYKRVAGNYFIRYGYEAEDSW